MPDLLLQAMDARMSGDLTQAKQLLAQALIQDPHNEGAWMLMSEVVDDVKLKRTCLQRVLLINPENSAANIALMKLDTSPLGPVVRGERYKPVIPPKLEKAPPFTPPFTWTGDEAQFQALGDMTYPDLTGEEVNQMPETPTSFDWANESAEPDKTIDKIFNAISNPEQAAEPLPDTDMSMLDDPLKAGAVAGAAAAGSDTEALALVAQGGQSPASHAGIEPTKSSESTVNDDEQVRSGAVATGNESHGESTELDFLLWDNPKAKTDRMVILGSKSIIYANPAASDVPHIMGLFNENKMLRDLLGDDAGTIKLDTIQRITANPKRTNLDIDYEPNEKIATHQLTFSDIPARDEALDMLQARLGENISRTTRKFGLANKILMPLLIIVLVAVIGWVLIDGLSYLEGAAGFQSGILQLILVNIKYYVDLIRPFFILMITIVLVALCLVWLVINLSKPSSLIIVERK
jgi:hypothetical protein